MEPAEETNAMKVLRQDVLKKSTDEFQGLQIQMSPLAGLALTIAPSEASVGQEGQRTVGGGGLENVAAEILQSRLTGPDGAHIENPLHSPDPSRDGGKGLRSLPL
jgi:hypothetical protein